MNILSINFKLKIYKFLLKFDYKQNINLFGVRYAGVGLTPKIPWDQKLVDCCLGSLCEEK
jgi:hypothetical protein